LKTKGVGDFLKFPTHPYTPYSGKQNQGYSNLKAGLTRRILQKPANELGFGARAKISSLTELQEQIGQECCITRDPVQIGIEFQSSKKFPFNFTLSDRNRS
jgi:hypothetical protein